MTDFARVKQAAQELNNVVLDLVGEAARNLDKTACKEALTLSLDEVLQRFAAAAKELRGDHTTSPTLATKHDQDEVAVEGENKRNLLYFEATSIRGLYDTMEEWQMVNKKRLLSTNIQRDGDTFCCIALSNPTEVVITDGRGDNHAHVTYGGDLCVVAHKG